MLSQWNKDISAKYAPVFFGDLFPCIWNNWTRTRFKNSSIFQSLVFQSLFELMHHKYFTHHNQADNCTIIALQLYFLVESLRACYTYIWLFSLSSGRFWLVGPVTFFIALETEILIYNLPWALVTFRLQNFPAYLPFILLGASKRLYSTLEGRV